MHTISRRSLLAKSGMGAAAAGALAAVPGLVAANRHSRGSISTATSASALRTAQPTGDVPTVAYIRDAAKGEVVLMMGTREVVHRDPALVAYLARVYGHATA
ncbi:MAG TPA: hypothetical protein VKV26_05220 [Dehalococcoidia bacterium]|nr:hypothetical protein [Dehalococcoidia bacterium]